MKSKPPAQVLLDCLETEQATLELLYSEACDDERPPIAARLGELEDQIDCLRREVDAE